MRLRSLIKEPSDLYSYTKKSSSLYRGVLNFLGYVNRGLPDWNSTQTIDVSMRLEDHHIFPRAFISSRGDFDDIKKDDAEQLVDSVVNRTLIPKILNIQIGKKSPFEYLSELKNRNPSLEVCLSRHLLPHGLVYDSTWSDYFGLFLEERAEQIYEKIVELTTERMNAMIALHGAHLEAEERQPAKLVNLTDLYSMGLIKAGDKLYVKKKPTEFAFLVDDKKVDYQGKKLPINAWGQQMTGWPSISVYSSIYLERTNEPIGKLRETIYDSSTSQNGLPTQPLALDLS